MKLVVRHSARAALLSVLLATSIGATALPKKAAAETPSFPEAAVQLMADITLIDQECRNVRVQFGPAFRASAVLGLDVTDVMPAGALRPDFEAAYRKRFADTSHEELCGPLVGRYGAELPGVFEVP